MELYLDCIPCLQRQALKALRETIPSNESKQEQILREVMKILLDSDWHSTPPELAHEIHSLIREKTGKDPYLKLKEKSNEFMLSKYPEFKKLTEGSEWLKNSIRLAIAGNIIDFGPNEDFNVEDTISRVMKTELGPDLDRFKNKLESASNILYFFDNAGEIVTDKILLENLTDNYDFKKISLVLKGGPIINDATLKDAKEVALQNIPNSEFLFLGNGEEGTGPERNSKEVEKWIKNHDLVIAKGQGNYEGMNGFEDIFFMLMAKCKVVANLIGVDKGTVVLDYNE